MTTTTRLQWLIRISVALSVLSASACLGERDVSALRDTAAPLDARTTADSATISGPSMGERAVRARHCASCHQSADAADGLWSGSSVKLAGMPRGMDAYAANLTPDPATGIATRSDGQIVSAIRFAIGVDGRALCGMPAYDDMDDSEARAIVAYLRGLDPVPHAIPPSVCSSAPDATTDVNTLDATLPDGAVVSDASSSGTVDAPPACVPRLVINEVQTAGTNGSGDEFVELFNASDCEGVSLAGYELRYASATGSTDARRWSGLPGDTIAAHGFVVVAGAGFRGMVTPIGVFSNAAGTLAATGAGLGLYDPHGTRIDALGYGTGTTNLDVEHAPTVAPPSGSSIARIPDGADTDDNRVDFTRCDAATPGTRNQCGHDGGAVAE